MIIQRKDRGNDHRIAGMNTDRIDILHAADRDAVIGGITHNFKFDFLVAFDALFHQDLMDR